ncbi:MAG: transglutaminaseTgpA domain-containing protein [Puniceicoccales bacterium]
MSTLTSVATSRVRLSQDELHQLKWLLGQLLALIAMWSLWSLQSIPHVLLFLFIVTSLTFTIYPALIGRIPPWVNTAATPELILIIAVDFVLHGSNFLDPMVRMVGLLTLYRATQFRKRREDLQLLLLALFTLIIVGVLLVSLSFAVQMLIFTPIAMGQLFLVNLLEPSFDRTLEGKDWGTFGWRRFSNRLRHGLDFRLIAVAGVLFAVVVAISTVIFISLPRIKMDQTLPFLNMQSTSTIGFSDTISYGDVAELNEGTDRIAMSVEVNDPDRMPSRPYWRMVTLDHYDPNESTFRHSTAARSYANTRIEEGYMFEAMDNPQRYMTGATIDEVKVYLEGNISSYLPLLGPFRTIQFPQRVKLFPNEEFNVYELDSASTSTIGYSMSDVALGESMLASRKEQHELNAIFGKPIYAEPGWGTLGENQYPATTLLVAASEDDRQFLSEAVEEITGGERLSAEEFSRRASEWLGQRYRYDLNTGLPLTEGGGQLFHWMRNADRGWCEHFAGSFIMLARQAGFPARAVAGFAGASWNDYEDFFVVRSRMAHAWVEIYDGQGRWRRVDPTPSSPLLAAGQDAGLPQTIQTESGWGAWLDSVRMVWYRRVINFDQADQKEIANNIRDMSVGAFEQLRRRIRMEWENLKEWFFGGWSLVKVRDVGLVILFIGGVLVSLRLLYQAALRWRSARSRGHGRTGGDPIRQKAGRVLTRFRPAYREAELALPEPEIESWRRVYEELIALRFGASPDTNHWKATLKSARRLIRSTSKLGSVVR